MAFVTRPAALPLWARDASWGCAVLVVGAAAGRVLVTTLNWHPTYVMSAVVAVVASAICIALHRVAPRLTLIMTVLGYPIVQHWPMTVELTVAPLAIAGFGATRSRRVPTALAALAVSAATLVVSLRTTIMGELLAAPWTFDPALLPYLRKFWTEQPTPNYSKMALAQVLVLGATAAGAAIARLERQRELLRDQNRELVQLRDVAAHQAVMEERTRIARELHDVMGHHVAAMVVRAQAAHRVSDTNPQAAVDAVEWIASLGRDALTQMRTAVKSLRQEETPDAGTWETLRLAVAHLRGTGLDVDLDIDADGNSLGREACECLTRIAQEALTNVLLHSQARHVHVQVESRDGGVGVSVVDPGPAQLQAPALQSGGNGLRNMAERARLAGGAVRAGPAGPGWEVTAWLPVQSQ